MLSSRPNSAIRSEYISVVPDLSRITIKPVSKDVEKLYNELYAAANVLKIKQLYNTYFSELIATEFQTLRSQIVTKSEEIILKDQYVVATTVCEIMWRKGYYELIMEGKSYWLCLLRVGQQDRINSFRARMEWLLESGIIHYKRLILKMNEVYSLNLNCLIENLPLSDILYSEKNFFEFYHVADIDVISIDSSQADKSAGYNTIYSFLLYLGDLHRYYCDFGFERENLLIKRKQAALYYMEAFLLCPSIGRAQNQLGLIFFQRNYDLDSAYHFIHSLICQIPFDLSETNLIKLFANRAGINEIDRRSENMEIKNFYKRFFEIVNIYFFGKTCNNFSMLCERVLLDFRNLIRMTNTCFSEEDIFKITAILLFCLSKLKMIQSPAVTSLNMFLMNICNELVSACLSSLEEILEEKYVEIEDFKLMYARNYEVSNFNQFPYHLLQSSSNPYTARVLAVSLDEKDSSSSCSSLTEEDAFTLKEEASSNSSISDLTEPLADTEDADKEETPSSSKQHQTVERRRNKYDTCLSESSSVDEITDSSEESLSDDEFYTDFLDSDAYGDNASSSDNNSNNSSNNSVYMSISNTSVITASNQPYDETDTLSEDTDSIDEHKQSVLDENTLDIQDTLDTATIQIDKQAKILVDPKSSSITEPTNLSNSEHMKEHLSPTQTVASLTDSNIIHVESNVTVVPRPQQYRPSILGKYKKNNPNITIDFAMNNPILPTLKTLMYWLNSNHDILSECCDFIPDLLNKLMKLSDLLNLDLLSQRLYFKREFIDITNVRESLRELLVLRLQVPLKEDIALKSFDLLQFAQKSVNWNICREQNITKEEQCLIRLTQIADFGFFICRNKRFGYHFCSKSRMFIRCVNISNITKIHIPTNQRVAQSDNSFLTLDPAARVRLVLGTGVERHTAMLYKNSDLLIQWLASEAAVLENKFLRINVNATNFLVVDSRAFVEYKSVVQDLIGLKKSIVIVTKAVISDLNFLKHRNEFADAASRWIDEQISLNNKFLRIQRDEERLPIPTLNLPWRLSYETRTFVEMLYLCNYLLSKRGNFRLQSPDQQIVTILCADSLTRKQCRIKEFSIASALENLSVRYEQILDYANKHQTLRN